jgi:hypothetical protein
VSRLRQRVVFQRPGLQHTGQQRRYAEKSEKSGNVGYRRQYD